MEMIDNRSDFKVFMQNYAYAHGNAQRGPQRRDVAREEVFVSITSSSLTRVQAVFSQAQASTFLVSNDRAYHNATPPRNGSSHRPTFGVDLAEQMARDSCEVPPILPKCCQAIEAYGLQSQGIYRLSGTTSKVAKLKERLDRGMLTFSSESASDRLSNTDLDSVDLHSEEWTSDINNVASLLKLWLRDLPEPLLTYSLQQGFIEAASKLLCSLSTFMELTRPVRNRE